MFSHRVYTRLGEGGIANDPDYLARFIREAQVLASLNHPNIAIIHGIEEDALVMELVPGAARPENCGTHFSW